MGATTAVGTTPFWAEHGDDVIARMASRRDGLTGGEAAGQRGAGDLGIQGRHVADWRLALRQVQSPIVLLLVGATALSMALGDTTDGAIILLITAASATLGWYQERGAVRAVEDLMDAVRVHADVRRDGREQEVLLDEVVVGDILVLRAGDVIAADARVLDSDALMVDESALTGESFPVEKHAEPVAVDAPLGSRTSAIWRGTSVSSGTGSAVVVAVGADTEFGRIGASATRADVPTAFELGLRRFGYLLMATTAVLVVGVFAVNVALDRPIMEALLFSLALAVGLTPQLLPTIVTVTLSHGARRMAARQVIVKRLDAIEDIGSVDVLCTDKTGTLTEGSVVLRSSLDANGEPSEDVRRLARCNATAQQGFRNPIDEALAATPDDGPVHRTIDELPYDFHRRLLSVLVASEGSILLITKGALESVLTRCTLDASAESAVRDRFAALSAEGLRVLGLATRTYAPVDPIPSTLTPDDERGLTFAGFLCFTDPPKADAASALSTLASLGVTTKLVTGDNRHAARHVAATVGIDTSSLVVGADLEHLDEAALAERCERSCVFAEIDPLQKERIVSALRRAGRTVAYLGDGINDAPSLRSADVGISVDTAVDIARHTAAVVLLQKDLAVLAEGIEHGRRVFANTIKYVQVTISANFGNMLSMAVAAAVLPFLPLLPRQILLLNFLSDIPGMTIAADRVDPEQVASPHGWDTRSLRSFMIVFGLVSSVFDLLTFWILRGAMHASPSVFRTGWFIESTATELAVMLVLRTWRPAWRSRPSRSLLGTSIIVAAITVALPFTGLAGDLGLVGPPAEVMAALVGITVGYATVTELTKRAFRRRIGALRDGPTPR